MIFKDSTEPKQSAIDAGYFEVEEGLVNTHDGQITYHTTKVTGKGQIYIIKRLLDESRDIS